MSIYVIGSINMDVVTQVPTHPIPGETRKCSDFSYIPGGKGSNQAIAAHRLGGEVRLVGKMGGDTFGTELQRFYEEEGLSQEFIVVDKESTTGAAFVAVDAQAENVIYVSGGANDMLHSADVENIQFSSDDIVTATLESPLETIKTAFSLAQESGAFTMLNAAPADKSAEQLFPLLDHLIVNELELSLLVGIDAGDSIESLAEAARTYAKKWNLNIVVTLGGKGVFAVGDAEQSIAGLSVNAVDTTGAGDCFCGAFAAGLHRGDSLEESLTFANSAAALSVQKVGAATSMPYLKDLNCT